MAWFKIDDGFHCHPKVLAAGNAAVGLWARLGAYASDQLTDGFVPVAIVRGYGSRAELRRLVEVRLVEPVVHPEYGDGFRLHDYLDYNPTAEKVRSDRADAAERQRRSRERRTEQTHGESRRDSGVTFGVSHTTPTRPEKNTSSSTDEVTKVCPQAVDIDAWAKARRT